MVQAISVDKLFLVDQTTPAQERVDAAVKRVQKSTPSAKVAIAPGEGKHKGGGQDGGGKKNGRESSSTSSSRNNNDNSFPSLPRDSEEASAKGGSREESWVGTLAPFVSPAACPSISLQTVPRSKTLESAHGGCA